MQAFDNIDNPNEENFLPYQPTQDIHHRGEQARSSLVRPSGADWGGRPSQEQKEDPNKQEKNSHLSDQGHKRDRFNSYYEYMLSVLGFAAGFGSLWRFPYLVFKNGGGAFLIPYLILLLVLGIPAFYFETTLGQMYQRGPPKIFEQVGKRWKGFGYLACFISLNEATYYNLILGYSFYYLWESFQFPLPWKVDWQTEKIPWNREYFYDTVLKSTDSINSLGGMVWPIFFCYAISQIIVYLCVQKGVAVSGKIALFTATSPYILLFVLMIRGFFLDGAYDGLSYLVTPDLSKLFSINVWCDAAAQIIFQFSTGNAILVFFGSYRDKKSELYKSSILIPWLTCLCGFLSAFTVFSYMGHMSKMAGIKISELPLSGPDLTFIAYPAAITMMPFENLWAIMFFSVMIFLGIDTQFGFVDGLAGTIEDDHGTPQGVKIGNRYFSMRVIRFMITCFIIFIGLLYSTQSGFYYLGFVDFYTTAFPSLLSVGIETYFFTHYQDWKTIELQVIRHVKTPTPQIYLFLLKYVVPTICFTLAFGAIIKQITMIFDQNIMVTLLGWFISLYPFGITWYIYQKNKKEDMEKEFDKQKELERQQHYDQQSF